MAQKFIIGADGVLRFGSVYLHKELLAPGESWCYGGGFWQIDHARAAVVLYGRSFDFGLPGFDHLQRIDWSGLGGQPHTLFYFPQWPDQSVSHPVTVPRPQQPPSIPPSETRDEYAHTPHTCNPDEPGKQAAPVGAEHLPPCKPQQSPQQPQQSPQQPQQSPQQPFLPRRIVVTGGSGFLGSRLVWYLEQVCGYTVFAPSHAEMELTDAGSCRRYLAATCPDAVVHTAAISSTGFCQEHPEASWAVNVEGTLHLLQAALQQAAQQQADLQQPAQQQPASNQPSANSNQPPIRFIYMSSDQVYQNDTNLWTETFGEEATDDYLNHPPRSIYGRHKLEMEQRAQALCPEAIGLRLTWLYDSRHSPAIPQAPEHLRQDHGIIANLQRASREGTPLKACTRERRGVTNVWKVVQAVAALLGKPQAPGGIYNCGEECVWNSYKLYQVMAITEGLDPTLILPDDSWARSLAMDTTKLRALLSS